MIYKAPVSLQNPTRMRALIVAALVLVAALAGCSGKKDDELHYECADGTEIHEDDYEGVLGNLTEQQVLDFLKTKCPKTGGNGGTGTGSKSSSATLAPNKDPVLALKVTSGTNATNVTTKGGNLTFDATGSTDADGTISAIAITVQDSNRTRVAQLYDAVGKKFKPATFTFDRPGVINVTVTMLDDRAGYDTILTKAFVNEVQVLGAAEINLPLSEDAPATHPCKGANQGAQSNLVDTYYFRAVGFNVVKDAQYIEAIPGADNIITICDPAGNAISAAKQEARVLSDPAGPLPTPTGIENYKIGVYAGAPNTDVSVTVIVHYEPKPAA